MPSRRTSDLHAYRWSSAGTRYFVTCCTVGRRSGLYHPPIVDLLREAVMAADTQRDAATIAFVVMPDHFHWLLELGERLTLGRIVARLKSQTRAGLAGHALAWQRDFFEHRLRADESCEDYARYVFLNPYRTARGVKLATPDTWWSSRPEHLHFLSMLNADGTPPAEWLNESFNALVTGKDTMV